MTNQEIFDTIVAYGRTMTERCAENGRCVYHRSDGNRCLIGGTLISDASYDPRFDSELGLGVETILNVHLGYNFNERTLGMIVALQCAHDLAHQDSFHADMEEGFANVACAFGLRATVLEPA